MGRGCITKRRERPAIRRRFWTCVRDHGRSFGSGIERCSSFFSRLQNDTRLYVVDYRLILQSVENIFSGDSCMSVFEAVVDTHCVRDEWIRVFAKIRFLTITCLPLKKVNCLPTKFW